MELVTARDREEWRRWLESNERVAKVRRKDEVWLLFYKKGTGRPCPSYEDAVEEALCYGWIDGIVRRIDANSYAQRFTPRKPGSKWSPSNLSRMERLIEEGRVTDRGMTVYLSSRRPEKKTKKPDAERQKSRQLTGIPEDLEAGLKGSPPTWETFQALPPSHKKEYVLWITGAKRAETRKRRVVEAVRRIGTRKSGGSS